MLTFKRTTKPTNPRNSVCIEVDGKEIWYDCSPEAKSYASQNFKIGDQVEIVKEQKDGKDYVSKVSRPGQAASTPAPTQAAPSGAGGAGGPGTGGQGGGTQAAPAASRPAPAVHSPTGKYRDPVTPDESKQMRRLSVLSSASTALAVVANTCTIDINTLPDTLVSLYNRLLAEVEKP